MTTGTNFNMQAGSTQITGQSSTDSEGGQLNLYPGVSTGLGRAVVAIKKSGVALVSSASPNNFVDGLITGGFKLLTNNFVTNILSLTVAPNTSASGFLFYTIEVQNSTDMQLETASYLFQVTNKAGVCVSNNDTKPGGSVGRRITAGSLNPIVAVLAGNPTIITVDPNSSFVSVSQGFPRISFSVLNLGNQAVQLL